MGLSALLMLICLRNAGAAEGEKAGFDHSDYAAVLKAYVNDNGMVNYKAMKANPDKLESFLNRIARLDKRTYQGWSPDEKIAFWINAYNGITLKVIIDHYPIKASWAASLRYPKNSIRQIDGAWDELKHSVMGRAMTLDDIEHETLRKDFEEPRIHVALVCAAMGCPPLRNEPYVGKRLKAQFADQLRSFLRNPKKFKIDRNKGRVYISPIFKWFGEDFEKKYATDTKFSEHSRTERAVLKYVSERLDETQARHLAQAKYDIKYLDYDWSLNEQ